jgi:SM-20-related protein
MASAQALASLGLFVRPGFIDFSSCARTQATMEAAAWTKATVSREEDESRLDEHVRRVWCVDIDRPTWKGVRSRLLEVKPEIEAHFGCALASCDGPDFLIYDPGAFYTPHLDNGTRYTSRAVSVVVFLNDAFSGGELTLYGLLDGPQWEKCPARVLPETGLLVAFRSGTLHEVRPVVDGRRCTIVAWFRA